MKKNRTYRSVGVERVVVDQVIGALGGSGQQRCIVAVDVAKTSFFAAIARPSGEVVQHLKFQHPAQLGQFLELVETLAKAGATPELVLEPTGTYGDVLRYQANKRGVKVFRVSPKRSHDAAEVFDGVPSHHDAKATAILARLHAQGVSDEWHPESEMRRGARALTMRREMYADPLKRHCGRLEALMARSWPELGEIVDINSGVAVITLLAEMSSPAAVAKNPDGAEAILRRASRGQLKREKVKQILESASNTKGVPLLEGERVALGELLAEMIRLRREVDRVDVELTNMAKGDPVGARLGAIVGYPTAIVLLSALGDPGEYANATSYQKACGLNLKEQSSGKKAGQLSITKRGPGVLRKYLFLAALRLIQTDEIVRAWYAKRKAIRLECKLKAVIAVMRKLSRALWHVARGATFDARRLFDVRALHLASDTIRIVTTDGSAPLGSVIIAETQEAAAMS